MMARAGWPETYIAQALGHGSAAITGRYIHLYDQAHEQNRVKLAHLLEAEIVGRRP